MAVQIHAIGKDFNMDSLPEVQEFIKAEVEHVIDEVVSQDDMESMIVASLIKRFRGSLDATVSRYKEEFEFMENELRLLRRTKTETEAQLFDAQVQIDKMQGTIDNMEGSIEGIITKGRDIQKVGKFADSLRDTITQMINIEQPNEVKETL